MIYDIRHVTTYRYEALVASARCTLRLLPRQDFGQTLLDSGLDVTPTPVELHERIDFFGNRTTNLRIETAHRELRLSALARVSIDRREAPAPGLTPTWETVRSDATATRSLDPRSPIHFVFPSRLVPLVAAATDYARTSFIADCPILEAAVDLMRRIKADFKFDAEATTISTPVAEAFEKRAGVCQDFAQIMIACMRGLGLPAAYVSGYIRTIPPPGRPRLEGADASHAWVSIWCGADVGWLDLDPTNNVLVADDHITVAIGRDYADVSPVDGVFLGSGKQKLAVSVDVVPVARG